MWKKLARILSWLCELDAAMSPIHIILLLAVVAGRVICEESNNVEDEYLGNSNEDEGLETASTTDLPYYSTTGNYHNYPSFPSTPSMNNWGSHPTGPSWNRPSTVQTQGGDSSWHCVCRGPQPHQQNPFGQMSYQTPSWRSPHFGPQPFRHPNFDHHFGQPHHGPGGDWHTKPCHQNPSTTHTTETPTEDSTE